MSTQVIEIIPNPISLLPFNLINYPTNFYLLNDPIVGSAGNDILSVANRAETQILAGGGNDVLQGDDTNNLLDGESGIDTVVYQQDPSGVEVDLAAELAKDGYGCSDLVREIENIIGSEFNDLLAGDDNRNSLTGRNGNDEINGRGGDDYLVGSSGQDFLTGGTGSDRFVYLSPNDGTDTIADFESGVDKITVVSSAFGGELSTGSLSIEQFGFGSNATNILQRFIFDDTTGDLLFDVDGSGAASQQLIANIGLGASFSANDIELL